MVGCGRLDTREANRKPAMSFKQWSNRDGSGQFSRERIDRGTYNNGCIDPMGGSCSQFIHVFLADRISFKLKSGYQVATARAIQSAQFQFVHFGRLCLARALVM
jgi:hypothetical protein